MESVWNSVQGNVVPAAMTSSDLLNNQLASALSTMGDAQYWEESISPATIRESLASADPSNPNSTPALLRGTKWLLACISKGRNVSDFYPHVVKLVGAPSLEVRKMVYMYLVQYADHDAATRELSLLSINSFQRGLADPEQWIRALALRVLTSIRVSDVLQIQILGVQKCAHDKSPYVRKCAANALAKLNERCSDKAQRDILLEIMTMLLQQDSSTMVLTSSIVAFTELCPYSLELLHAPFRKICHLLTDMDEWGQVVVIDTMARYCRKFFSKPKTVGSAQAIDEARRVRRTVSGIARAASTRVGDGPEEATIPTNDNTNQERDKRKRRVAAPQKIKRRVVKKGFYSDEEDESTDEEVYQDDSVGVSTSLVGVLRDDTLGPVNGTSTAQKKTTEGHEDEELHEDHRLLLRSSLPLLKSRNSGVVLAVCSLHYYCGVASIKVRSALGKALVRIHRDRREIQYVVLSSIRTLVSECPSAFTPFLNDFFVTAMDPSYTRMIKLDILTSLVLEPASIEAVLKELRTYIRHDDKAFVCASIRAVGKVVELARIVYDRLGEKNNGNVARARGEADRIALNCLYGLLALTQACDQNVVVGECVMVMQRIMVQLMADSGGIIVTISDSNHVQDRAMQRIVLLLASSLVSRTEQGEDAVEDDDEEKATDKLNSLTISLPPDALGSALWIVSEWLSSVSTSPMLSNKMDGASKSKMRLELIRLVAKSFPKLSPCEKTQGVHFASKLLVSAATGTSSADGETAICENVLSMGRIDVNTDVRDRARFESAIVHLAVGLKYDTDAMATSLPSTGQKLTVENAKAMLLRPKPPSSSLPIEDEKENDASTEVNGPFRFGTLSSLVSHRARQAYLPLPEWAKKDSPASLRDPPSPATTHADEGDYGWKVGKEASKGGFYDSDGETGSSDSSSESSSESDSSSEEESTSSSEDSDSSSSDVDSDSDSDDGDVVSPRRQIMPSPPKQPSRLPAPVVNGGPTIPSPRAQALVDAPSSESSSDSDDEESSSNESDSSDETPTAEGSLLQMGTLPQLTIPSPAQATTSTASTNGTSSIMQGFEGLVMAPVVVNVEEKVDPDAEKDSGAWFNLVRPSTAGGLEVTARYLRGPTREREAKLIGLDPESVTTVCLQIKFENKRTDAGILRRVRIIQRSNTHGSIGTHRVVTPEEIVALKTGQMTTAILGISFQSAADRDGALQARFDFKSDRGSTAVDIRPSLGDMLQPCRIKTLDFDSNVEALQGFSRVTTKFQLPPPVLTSYNALPTTILKHAALTLVDKAWKNDKLRFVGSLPASLDKIYVVVECSSDSGAGTLTVCCEHPLCCNTLKDALKSAVSSSS